MSYDAHNYKKRLEEVLKKIRNDPSISERNKQAIIKFQENCFVEKISTGRIAKYMYDLRNMAKWLGKDFEDANKDDIKALMGKLEKMTYYLKRLDKQVPYQESTKRDFRIAVRKFYKFLRDTEDFPEEVRWIKSTGRKNERLKLPEDMLTEEDIKKLLNATDNPRDKAFVSILYESGCRIGEMLFLKIKHAKFDQFGAQLLVNGKTGYRPVRIITSVPFLTEWINKHPKKDEPESPLWITRNYTQMNYAAITKSLKIIAKKAGVKKRMNPHNFRHSRATYLANHLTEAQMKEFFGWVQASDMASIYVHLSGRDVDNAVLKMHGIKNNNEKQESELKPKNCPRCQQINPFSNKFCSKCGFIFDESMRNQKIKQDLERKHANQVLDKMLEDAEFKEMFMKKAKNLLSEKEKNRPEQSHV